MASSMPSWSAVIEEPSALQIRMKLLQGQSHAPFDRAQWHPDHLGDLAMRVTPKVRELDGLTLLGRQAGQRLLDHVPLDRLGDLEPGVGAEALGLGLEWDLAFLTFVRVAAPEVVDRTVAHRGDDPGAQRAAMGVEPRGTVPELEEGVLDHVLGPPRVAHDAQGDGEGQRTVPVVEARQRVDVPRSQSFSDV